MLQCCVFTTDLNRQLAASDIENRTGLLGRMKNPKSKWAREYRSRIHTNIITHVHRAVCQNISSTCLTDVNHTSVLTEQLQYTDSFSWTIGCSRTGVSFIFFLWLHLQDKSNERNWGRLWVSIRYTLSMPGHLDMSRGESSHESGWCEQVCPDRLIVSGLGTGDIWFVGSRAWGDWGWGQLVVKPSAVREQTDGEPNVTQRCTVIYVHSTEAQAACCNYYQLKFAIFATVFLVSLILCFRLGVGGHG